MENTSDYFMPRPLLFCMKSEKSVCYSVPDNRILKNRGKAQPLIVGGYSNFLFLNREGLPKVAGNYEGMVRGLIKKYNKYHTDKLPNITPHSFRHTYCTNMANRGMNPNTLQYLMGHANMTMTLGYYAHGTFQSAKAELERLAC